MKDFGRGRYFLQSWAQQMNHPWQASKWFIFRILSKLTMYIRLTPGLINKYEMFFGWFDITFTI